jgi:hypothetical protein
LNWDDKSRRYEIDDRAAHALFRQVLAVVVPVAVDGPEGARFNDEARRDADVQSGA